MIKGKSLTELAAEVERQAKAMEDFIVPMREMEMLTPLDEPELFFNGEHYPLTGIGHQTLAERMDIPAKYYNRMLETNPHLLAHNVNGWAKHKENAGVSRMVRTLDGSARAILSDHYKRQDNHEFLCNILPVLMESGKLEVQTAEVSERRLYVQCTFPEIQQEFEVERQGRKVGDVVRAGLLLSNSEVGMGCMEIKMLIYQLSCTNGVVVPKELGGVRTRHLGRKQGGGGFFQLSQEALDADAKAFSLASRDMVRQMVSRDHLHTVVERITHANDMKITGDVTGGVKVLASTYQLTKMEEATVLDKVVRGGDLSLLGLVDAITATANDYDNYDRAVELESIGGLLLYAPANTIRPMLTAKAA